ncbi:MAG: hypothetical protein AAFW75_02830 [Cyanobacteria bacterium J06636_16]
MLLQIIPESLVQPFKFWFDGGLQDGLHFCNEFYYRLQEQPLAAQDRLQQYARQLAQDGTDVLLSADDCQCSLWVNLRNRCAAAYTKQ